MKTANNTTNTTADRFTATAILLLTMSIFGGVLLASAEPAAVTSIHDSMVISTTNISGGSLK